MISGLSQPICNTSFKQSKSIEFAPVKRPIPRNELIIKRTENAIYFHAVPVVFGLVGLYFMIKQHFRIKDLKYSEMLRYNMDRNGKFPERTKKQTILVPEVDKSEAKGKVKKLKL